MADQTARSRQDQSEMNADPSRKGVVRQREVRPMQFNVSVLLIIHAALAVLLLGGITHHAIATATLFGLVLALFAVTLCAIAYTCNVLLPYATKT